MITAYNAHLVTSQAEDSAAIKRRADCEAALVDLNNGQALHDVQFVVGLTAPDLETLKANRDAVMSQLKPFVSLRHEVGTDQVRAARFFSLTPTREIGLSTPWPMTSQAAALTPGFLGIPKLQSTEGILRGTAINGGYPVFYDSWETRHGKKATHEIWVGMSGSGKTFYLLCYLARELAHNGVPWDFLEPMGHGQAIAQAFGVPAMSLSTRRTCLNPHDVMFDRVGEQISHVISLYETILGRSMSGGQEQNVQKALLAQALSHFYEPFAGELDQLTPAQSFLVDDLCDVLYGLGDRARVQGIARELADEIGGLCTGNGPYAHAFNGPTTVDFSIHGSKGAARLPLSRTGG